MQIGSANTVCATIIPNLPGFLAQHSFQSSPELLIRELSLQSLLATPAHCVPFLAITEQGHDALDETLHAGRLGEKSALPILDYLRNAARYCADAGSCVVHGFEKNDSKSLFCARKHKQVAGIVVTGQKLMRYKKRE